MENDNTTESVKVKENKETPSQGLPPHSKWWILCVVIGFLCTVVAWVSMVFDEYVSVSTCVVGFVLSIISTIGVRRSLLRDIAITCLIATTVLLVVFCLFFFGLNYAVNLL